MESLRDLRRDQTRIQTRAPRLGAGNSDVLGRNRTSTWRRRSYHRCIEVCNYFVCCGAFFSNAINNEFREAMGRQEASGAGKPDNVRWTPASSCRREIATISCILRPRSIGRRFSTNPNHLQNVGVHDESYTKAVLPDNRRSDPDRSARRGMRR